MRMREVNVSEEYLESLCEWMMEWVKKDDALTVSQFLQCKGIGYPFFNYMKYQSPKVHNTFEVMKSILCNRWFHMAMTKETLPPHRAKLLMRYIRLYDSHGYEMELDARKTVAEAEKKVEVEYFAENYAREKLTGLYRDNYEKNDDKRRSQEEAK
jgi:hypothetical protein